MQISEWVHYAVSSKHRVSPQGLLGCARDAQHSEKGAPALPVRDEVAFEDIAANVEVIRTVLNDPDQAALSRQFPNLRRILDNMVFYQEFQFTLKVLRPVSAGVRLLKKDDTRLGEVIPIMWAIGKYTENLLVPADLQVKVDAVKASLNKRRERYEQCPATLVAMILHPLRRRRARRRAPVSHAFPEGV